MLQNRTVDPERDAFEPPEGKQDGASADPECDAFRHCCEAARGENEVVEDVSEHQDGKVERWKLGAEVQLIPTGAET